MPSRRPFALRHHCCSSAATWRRHCSSRHTLRPSVSAVWQTNFNIVRCPCNGLCLVKRHLNLYIDITLHYTLHYTKYTEVSSRTLKLPLYNLPHSDTTGSSATADGPRDALCPLKSCQLMYNCTKITYKWLAVGNDFEGDSTSSKLPLYSISYISLPISGL